MIFFSEARRARLFARLLVATCWFCLAALPAAVSQTYPFSSTADTVFDIIKSDDPTEYVCLNYEGRASRQMWDKRIDGESYLDVFLFTAHYRDAPPIDIILNPEFRSEPEARAEALRYAFGLGQLPVVFRQGLKQFGVHKGNKGFHGGPGKVFMYQDKADLRVSQNKLEESLLHEAVHASLDALYRDSAEWKAAQKQDDAFITRYAGEHPNREDLAESALFAYG
ncbi:MAG: hypothetical protein AB3N11_00555, partial [Arenibacterium sp.]